MAKSKPLADLPYEKSMVELEAVLEKLEEGDRDLQETLDLFERGRELMTHCRKLLEDAQLRVSELEKDDSITEDGDVS